jgi:hypothetical protein
MRPIVYQILHIPVFLCELDLVQVQPEVEIHESMGVVVRVVVPVQVSEASVDSMVVAA